ncbi:UDP-glucose/GDP-mannose dehydrogenase family protein [Acuticoccus mangrovi]|uniref:UDP-glucose 6-dehydrogenase n=1 Tax=Acuticoccus mangrovi TaxID=2796142 RepID=A0A934IMU3_9HYPH|nr:UDP-glucose/GDP-mannose dehydrogenase family protein [Acuticoccus mangrovi]MBJ3776747.1 UDP-glucose/GDP-mannose dehydrogenase family protein [Acuticoccus mangrovi]
MNIVTTPHTYIAAELFADLPAIAVIGLGRVGAVSAACLASLGHRVMAVDCNVAKIASFTHGHASFYEPSLDALLGEGIAAGRIDTTTVIADAVADTDVTIIAIGTPLRDDGGYDGGPIRAVAREIGIGLRETAGFHVIALRSAVPRGTTEAIIVPAIERASGKRAGVDFGICVMPDFMVCGKAVESMLRPFETVIGVSDPRSEQIMRRLFSAIDTTPMITSLDAAESMREATAEWFTKVPAAHSSTTPAEGPPARPLTAVLAAYLSPSVSPPPHLAPSHEDCANGCDLYDTLVPLSEVRLLDVIAEVKAARPRKVAVLGLDFANRLDDLRMAAVLDIIAELRGAGILVAAHDPAVTDTRALAREIAVMKHSSRDLRALAFVLDEIIRPTAADALCDVDMIILARETEATRSLIEARPQIRVVDLAPALPGPATGLTELRAAA